MRSFLGSTLSRLPRFNRLIVASLLLVLSLVHSAGWAQDIATPLAVSQIAPMDVNSSRQVVVSIRNDGTVAWSPGSGYALVSEGDNWGITSVPLPAFVAAGEDVATFIFTIKAPAVAGVYSFKWRFRKGATAMGAIISQSVTVNSVGTNTPPTASWITPQISLVKYKVTRGEKAAVQLSASGSDPGGSVTSMQVFR